MNENDILQNLNEQFPEKIIVQDQIDNLLYLYLHQMLKEKKIPIETYLTNNNFAYTATHKMINEQEVIELLNVLYPDRKVYALSSKYFLQNQIRRVANGKGLTYKEWLKKHNYNLLSPHEVKQNPEILSKTNFKNNFDEAIKYDDYEIINLTLHTDISISEIARYLQVSPNSLSTRMKNKNKNNFTWSVETLSKQHMYNYDKMIDESIKFLETATGYYRITNELHKKKFQFLFFPKKKGSYPLNLKHENIPVDMINALISKDFHIFNVQELLFLNKVQQQSLIKPISPSYSKYNKLKKLAKIHSNYYQDLYNGNEYTIFTFAKIKNIKLKHLPKNKETIIKELVKQLLSYYNPATQEIEIKSSDPNYSKIVSQITKLGFNLQEFIELQGFNYKKKRLKSQKSLDNIKTKIIESLNDYKVNENTVCLPYDSNLYINLSNKARKQNSSLDEYLKTEFNLNRVKLNSINKHRETLNELEEYKVDEKTVYIPSDTKFYIRLYNRARRRKITLAEYLQNEYGLTLKN